MKSGLFSLQWRDGLKALLMTVGTTFASAIGISLNNGSLPTMVQVQGAGIAGLSAGVVYILKNLFTDDVKAATKTIEKAGGAVVPKTQYNTPTQP